MYVGGDEERMIANFIDEDEPNLPVFNEEIDMERLVYELTALFHDLFWVK